MLYTDRLYGAVDIPESLMRLAGTKAVQRLLNISQDSLPEDMVPHPVASRFEHSVGVLSLMLKMLACNSGAFDKNMEELLLVSALLHDAGSPPFSHLAEPFLEKLTRKNGESFLSEMVMATDTETILMNMGLSVENIVDMVTGKRVPLATVLHGTMDIDNIDNVLRYYALAKGTVPYDGSMLAQAFRFNGTEWTLLDTARDLAAQWQETRRLVYEFVYGEPHQGLCMMVFRALALACDKGDIGLLFFKMNDVAAIYFLQKKCNMASSRLITEVLARRVYPVVFSEKTSRPSSRYAQALRDPLARHHIADFLAQECGIPREAVCVYAGKGRDKRKITLPFVSPDGTRSFDAGEHFPIYRLIVYLHPDLAKWSEKIARLVQTSIF